MYTAQSKLYTECLQYIFFYIFLCKFSNILRAFTHFSAISNTHKMHFIIIFFLCNSLDSFAFNYRFRIASIFDQNAPSMLINRTCSTLELWCAIFTAHFLNAISFNEKNDLFSLANFELFQIMFHYFEPF